jgi:hypothetical protein
MSLGFHKSRRSGGPKTPAGKLVASQNSLKSGVYSVQAILPGEDPAQLHELEQSFIEDFSPQGVVEAALVHSLVVIAWKKLRLERLEYRYIRDKLNQEPTFLEIENTGVKNYPDGVGNYLLDTKLIESCDGELAKEYLRYCNILKECGWTETDLLRLKKESLKTFTRLYELMLVKCDYSETSLFDMATIPYSFTHPRQPIENVIDILIGEAQAAIWVFQNKEKLLQAHQQIRDKRLISALQFERPQRAADELDRSFFKTLAELRKQQDWRARHDYIDVTSKSIEKP